MPEINHKIEPVAAVEALGSLLSSPEIPACMRDAKSVAEAASRCQSIADPDPARAIEAVRAVSGLPGELRVPGALLYMSSAGSFWRSATPNVSNNLIQAPFNLSEITGPSHLAAILEDFAWRAASCVLSGEENKSESREDYWQRACEMSQRPYNTYGGDCGCEDLPDWLKMPVENVVPVNKKVVAGEKTEADRLAKPEKFLDFSPVAESALGICFCDYISIPEQHLSALSGIWRITGLPFEVACAAISNSLVSLDFLRGYGHVPPSLRVPYFAALLRAHSADGRAEAFYAKSIVYGRRNSYVPIYISSPYSYPDGEVYMEAEKIGHFLWSGQGFFPNQKEIQAKQYRDSVLDEEIKKLAALHFSRDGSPKNPARLAKMCIEEANLFNTVKDLGKIGVKELATLISKVLSMSGYENTTVDNYTLAAKAVGLCFGKDIGKFAGYLTYNITQEQELKDPLFLSMCRDLKKDAEELIQEVLGTPIKKQSRISNNGGVESPFHSGVVEVVALAVSLAKTNSQILTRAKALLGSEGRKLLKTAR